MFTGHQWNILHTDYPPIEDYQPPETDGYKTSIQCGKVYLHCPDCGLGHRTRQGARSCCSAKKIERNERKQQKKKLPPRFAIMLDCEAGVKNFYR